MSQVCLDLLKIILLKLRLQTEAAIRICQFSSASLSTLLQMGVLPRQQLTRLSIQDHLGKAFEGQLHYIYKYVCEHKR